jgi:hypothetical protein
MYSDTNTTRSVADAVMKVMNEKLHPNQQQLDVHEPEKDELTADDFKKLRDKKKKIEEATPAKEGQVAAGGGTPADKGALAAKYKKEEVEQIQEYESKDGKFVHNAKTGRYGGSEKPTDPFAGVRGPGQKDLAKIEAEKKKKKFSEMVGLYQEKGLKALSEMLVKEEPTNDEYKKELEDQKAKANGEKRNPDIAKGKVDAVKQEEVEQQDVEQIDEREMTDAEMKNREKIVKSMKKGMAGFKERYGDRAKNVMYATATKQAMK